MEKIDLDKILNSIGGWGKFQMRAYIPLCCVVIFSVFQMSYIFVARDTKYRCLIRSCNDSLEYNPDWLKNAVPFDEDVPNRCLYYQPEQNKTCTQFNKNVTRTCDEFVFERDQTTIVQDFNITCDENLWKLTIVGTISVIGELICLTFIGIVSDRFGRKFAIVVSMFLTTTIGLVRSFAPSYYSYLALEFLDTALGSGTYGGAFILALEIVDTRRRSMANTIICFAFAFGQVILGLSAWISPSWRIMLRLIYLPGFLITASLWYVPESVRWLISKNKFEKARDVLEAAARTNGRELNNESLIALAEEDDVEEGDTNFMTVFKSGKLVFRIIHCSYTWICCNFPYYGLTIQSVALSEDLYINFICTALIELPAYFLTQKIMDRWGRRKALGFSLILGGVSCVCVHFAENENWLTLVVFLSGKFFITMAYTTLYIYTAEMFPTKLRHSIFAVCSMFGRFGSMMAPQVPLLGRVFKSLPLVIFSAMAFSSGVLAFWFPETLHTELPDEIEEAIDI